MNIHASLLPRWRGAAPIHRGIEAGDTNTGVTIMQMDAGLDTGDMLLGDQLTILPSDSTGVLHDKLADMGGKLIVQALAHLPALKAVKQTENGVTYANKIEKHEAAIDWSQGAAQLCTAHSCFQPLSWRDDSWAASTSRSGRR